jgi:hypothetical protein
MVGGLLLRGMMAGVIAGLLAFGFARVFGEPPVNSAGAAVGGLFSLVFAYLYGRAGRLRPQIAMGCISARA